MGVGGVGRSVESGISNNWVGEPNSYQLMLLKSESDRYFVKKPLLDQSPLPEYCRVRAVFGGRTAPEGIGLPLELYACKPTSACMLGIVALLNEPADWHARDTAGSEPSRHLLKVKIPSMVCWEVAACTPNRANASNDAISSNECVFMPDTSAQFFLTGKYVFTHI